MTYLYASGMEKRKRGFGPWWDGGGKEGTDRAAGIRPFALIP
jgi:hypothetical protein